MNHNGLRAALALAALNTRDRKWICARLSEAALRRLSEAEARIEGTDLNELASRLDEEGEGTSGMEQEQRLLQRPEAVTALLKSEPIWVRQCVLAAFSSAGRTLLGIPGPHTDHLTLPGGLRHAIVQSLCEAIPPYEDWRADD